MTERYEAVADEYYNRERHPTCANFRDGSKALLSDFVLSFNTKGRWLEVGCGDSVVAELLTENRNQLRGLVLTDSAPRMLQYSNRWRSYGAELAASDAEALAFDDQSFDLVIGSLGDPYNTDEFWSEARRCLRPGGRVVFTTPSFEWASEYRPASHYPLRESEFLLADGTELTLPSVVLPETEQTALIESNGFHVSLRRSFAVAQLRGRVSPKLRLNRSQEGTIVVAYEASLV